MSDITLTPSSSVPSVVSLILVTTRARSAALSTVVVLSRAFTEVRSLVPRRRRIPPRLAGLLIPPAAFPPLPLWTMRRRVSTGGLSVLISSARWRRSSLWWRALRLSRQLTSTRRRLWLRLSRRRSHSSNRLPSAMSLISSPTASAASAASAAST